MLRHVTFDRLDLLLERRREECVWFESCLRHSLFHDNVNPPSRINLNVWRPSNGTWYVNPAISPGPIPIVNQWGLPGDIPVAGDFNGDGQQAYAVWRPSEGNWYVSFRYSAGASCPRVNGGSWETFRCLAITMQTERVTTPSGGPAMEPGT